MGSLIGSAAGAACAFICCGACRQCSEAKRGSISRLPYIFLFFLCSIFAIIMSLYGEKKMNFEFFSFSVCNDESCYGNGSVFRVSFCLFIFEALHVLIIWKGAVAFHYSFFPVKFLCLMAAITASFLIKGSNDTFNNYAEVARYFSGLYLVIQILILICYAYDISEYIRNKGDREYAYNDINDYEQNCCCGICKGNRWYWWLGVGSILLFILSYTFNVLFYFWFDPQDKCLVHETVISLTLVLISLTATFSVIRGNGSFFVCGIVSLYSVFLLFTAIQADPDAECNLFMNENRDSSALWLGCLITLVSLLYAAMRSDMIDVLTKESAEELEIKKNNIDPDEVEAQKEINKKMGIDAVLLTDPNVDDVTNIKMCVDENEDEAGDDGDGDIEESNYADADEKRVKVSPKDGLDETAVQWQNDRKSNVYFHVIMMLASAYMSMLFTNWGSNTESIDSVGTVSFWIAMSSQWLTFLLFWWTIMAPKICPSRFGDAPDADDDE